MTTPASTTTRVTEGSHLKKNSRVGNCGPYDRGDSIIMLRGLPGGGLPERQVTLDSEVYNSSVHHDL